MSSLVVYRFAFPQHNPIARHEVLARIIEAIPDGWGWISGRLKAPLDHPNVAWSIGLNMYAGQPRFVINEDGQRDTSGPWTEVLLGARLAYVSLEGDRYHSPWVLGDARRLAAAYVREGYVGSIRGITDYGSVLGARNVSEVVEDCRLEIGETPSVQIRFDPEQGGKETRVAPILAICRQLELAEERS